MREFTKYVHGKEILGEKFTRSLSVPIYQTAIFTFSSAEEGASIIAKEKDGYFYTRLGNPTVRAFEEKMAFLEEGEDACAFASGMAAITAVIFALAKAGDEILASYPIYGCTYSLFTTILPNLGIKVKWLLAKNFIEELKKEINKNTKIVFIETPTNPTIEIIDIKEVAEIAHRYDAKVIVDNTFATTFNQKPLKLNADISLHSATKYISGHGDTLGGVVISNKEIIENLKENLIRNFGGVLSPFNAWLLLRGLKTLALRMSRHNENGLKVAQFLENHPKIKRVSYPGLPSHPQYEIAKKQMSGFSSMIAFELKGGREAGRKLMNNIKLCVCAVSLGDTATLIEHPASMTHFTYSKEDLEKSGISEGLVRMSVGIEDSEDIIEDLEQALAKV
ncbi:MAG: aminotransferase class I/II-fold pyridoxal phosphate-dependent enzyme [candidate division WOR-3 bacterium]|uniref:L-methionine gamma-lyase n=1 Tax=candidate division WOR-3 bacterium TaxID=2052148 RepID=A0A7C4VYI0_UNCW3